MLPAGSQAHLAADIATADEHILSLLRDVLPAPRVDSADAKAMLAAKQSGDMFMAGPTLETLQVVARPCFIYLFGLWKARRQQGNVD